MFPSKLKTLSPNMLSERRHHDSASSISKSVFSKKLFFDQKIELDCAGGHATTIFGFLIEFRCGIYHDTLAGEARLSSRPHFVRDNMKSLFWTFFYIFWVTFLGANAATCTCSPRPLGR